MYQIRINGERVWFPINYENVTPICSELNNRIFTAYDSATERYVVIKKICNPFVNVISAKSVLREFRHLNSIEHHNIIKLLNAYTPQESPKEFSDIYLVTEKMDMDLAEFIKNQCLHNYVLETENISFNKYLSFLVYQMLCGIHHLHQNKIIHRNLTPEHIVIDNDSRIKILNFGQAKNANESNLFHTPYVVPQQYRAPEVIFTGTSYDEKVDVWSIGCIFGEIITGETLFKGSNSMSQWKAIAQKLGDPEQEFLNTLQSGIRTYIERNSYEPVPWDVLFPDEKFPKMDSGEEKNFTKMARDLLSKMLVVDPEERISVKKALEHPYFYKWYRPENFATPVIQNVDFVENEEFGVNDWKSMLFDKLQEYNQNRRNLANNFNGGQNGANLNNMDDSDSDYEDFNRIMEGVEEYEAERSMSEASNSLSERGNSIGSNISNISSEFIPSTSSNVEYSSQSGSDSGYSNNLDENI